MAQQIINIGAVANDGTGDQLRISFDKCNGNFTELYAGVAANVPTGNTIEYKFNNSTIEPPLSGQVRFNQAVQASTTKMWVSQTTSSGINIKQFLSAATTGAKLILQDKNDNTNYVKFDVTGAPVDKTTYWEFTVAVTASGGTLPNAPVLAAVTGAAGGGITQSYVDTQDALRVLKAGDTMTGALVLAADPVSNLQAATKQYVDVYAAPVDALADSGMQINGSMTVSQEKGAGGTSISNTYICDGWMLNLTGTMAVGANAFADNGIVAGMGGMLAVAVNTAQTTLGAGDLLNVAQKIEGYRLARLAWGGANAQPLTIGFWTVHHRPGTYCVSFRNPTADRSYVATYTQNVADTQEYKVITVPGCTSGTWPFDNTIGMYINFSFACGTTYQGASANAWLTTNSIAVAAMVNGAASTSDVFHITGVVVLPGIQAPSAARSPFIMRPYDQELAACKRYFQMLSGIGWSGIVSVSTNILAARPILQMRSTPTALLLKTSFSAASFEILVGTSWVNSSAMVLNSPTPTADGFGMNLSGFSGLTSGQVVYLNSTSNLVSLDARL